MKSSNLFINLSAISVALQLASVVNLPAQNELIGYTFMGGGFGAVPNFYYISDCEATWDEANEAANDMGGSLATIVSFNQNYFIGNWVVDYAGYDYPGAWIGFHGIEGNYEWADGNPSSWNQWYGPEPVHSNGAALIGTIESTMFEYYFWTTEPISNENRYVVEFTSQPNCNNNPNKTYVCHNGNTICVNTASVQAHLDHGDLAGPCGPCNTYAMQTIPDNEPKLAGQAIHTAKHALLRPGEGFEFDNENNQLHVYPNPASAEMHVVLPVKLQQGILRVLTLTGQEIHTLQLTGQQSIVLDLTAYAQGLYLIDVQSTGGHYQKKMVKL